MTTRKILITAAALALAAVPAILIAQSGHGGHRPGARMGGHGGGSGGDGFQMIRGFLGRLGDKLDLTDEQRARIEAIADEEGPAIRSYLDEARDLRWQFAADHDPGSFDETSFRTHAEEQARIEVEIKVVSARAMARVWGVLTDEQKQELGELRELMGPRGRFGGHRGGPGAGAGPDGS